MPRGSRSARSRLNCEDSGLSSRGRFKDRGVALLTRSFFFSLRCLPRPLATALCRGLAGLVWRIDSKHRRIGIVNLDLAFPNKDRAWKDGVLRQSYLQLGDLAVEVSRLPGLSRGSVARRVRYDEGFGLEHYYDAKADGKGVLFLTAHVSAWELLPAAHALLGEPLGFLARPLDNPDLERWLRRVRTYCGNEVISKRLGMRRAIRRLRSGQAVGFLLDQNVQEKDGVFAPFFGRPACTSSALAALALRTGAPVVAGFIRPDVQPGSYRIRFHPPVRLKQSDDWRRDLVSATTVFNQLIEEAIRRNPESWLWGHRRFSTQPRGTCDPYASG